MLADVRPSPARAALICPMERLDGLLRDNANGAHGLDAPPMDYGEGAQTPLARLRVRATRETQDAAEEKVSQAVAEAKVQLRQLVELELDWACESCMTVDNRPQNARCHVCSAWRSDEHREAFEAEKARKEAEMVAEAARLVKEREAEESARLTKLKAKLSMTRDERVAVMLGRLANRKMFDAITCWILHVEAARVKRQAEAMHSAYYRLGKRCQVGTEENLRQTLHDRYVHLESGTEMLEPESLLTIWRSKTATYAALCGKTGVIVATSAEERAVELQFAANLHQTSGEVTAFWLPIEVCCVVGHETVPTPAATGPQSTSRTANKQSAKLEPEPEQHRGDPGAEQEESLEQRQLAAAVIIQARWRGFSTRRQYGPELERTRGWTEHDHLMETIRRLERGVRANFNLQFPNARRSEDPAITVVREEWQAAIGEGPHWSPKMIARHIAEALDDDLGLALSGDAVYPDGIVRRRISPEDGERILSAVQVEVSRRKRLGLAGSRAIAALAAEDEQEATESSKSSRTVLADGEYEERHLVETVKQCIEDLILQLELAENPNFVSDRAMDHWSRTRLIADRIAAASSAKAMGEHQAWFQPQATRWLGSLALNKLRLTDLGAGVIAAQLPKSNLHTLVLHECGLSSEGVLAIASILHCCPALNLLDLRGNAALNAGLRAVAGGVTHPGCGLRSAFLTFNMNAKEWSTRGLEDGIRCLNAVIPHSRLTNLKLDFRYEVISRARPFRQQKTLKLHTIDFAQRQSTPLPEWLQVGGSCSPKHAVTDEMRTRLWANLRRASHAARQRLAWAVLVERVPILITLDNVLHERLRLAVAERTRRDACTMATGGVAGQTATGQYIPLAHHYITRRKVMAREGIEADSRSLRFLEQGEIVAGLEVKCDRRSGGEPRLRFIFAMPPMIGVQGWAPLSESLPPGPTKSEAEAAAAAATEAARKQRASTEASIRAEEQRWKKELAVLEQAVEDARRLPLGEEMLSALLKAEKAVLAANKEHRAAATSLELELAEPPPKPLVLPSHRSWQMGQLEHHQTTGDTVAIRRALNIEGDLLTPLAGCQPIPGDGRDRVRKQRYRQRQLVCTTGLAEAMVAHRNSLPPENYGAAQADFVFVVAADGRWPVKTARRVLLMSFTEDNSVKFHSRLRIVPATCAPLKRQANQDLVSYQPQAEKRQEALYAEAPRWQSHCTVQELSKWLVDESGFLWPAGWACVRVADVLSVVEVEGELVEQRETLAKLHAQMSELRDLSAELDTQLVKAVEALEVVEHAHELAAIEAKYYDGTKLDGTEDCSSPTTVLVSAAEKLRAQEEDRARNRRARLEQERDGAQMSDTAVEKKIADIEHRIGVLEHSLASCAISDSLELDWANTLIECHPDEKPSSLADRWAQEEREEMEEEDDQNADEGNSTTHGEDSSPGKPKETKTDAATPATNFRNGEGGMLGEALALRALRLDARLPALHRQTELLPLPISSHHVHNSEPPLSTPGGQLHSRRLNASPSRLLAPLQDAPAAPVLMAASSHQCNEQGGGAVELTPLTPEQTGHKQTNSSPLFGRG